MGYSKGAQEWLTAWDVPKNGNVPGAEEGKEKQDPAPRTD